MKINKVSENSLEKLTEKEQTQDISENKAKIDSIVKKKEYLTQENNEIMNKWKLESPDFYNKYRNIINFQQDFIEINLPNNGIVKIDREDLSIKCDWKEARNQVKLLGKRLPIDSQLGELLEIFKRRKLIELLHFNDNYSYWLDTEVKNTADIWHLYLEPNSGGDWLNKEMEAYIRCFRK